MAYNSQFTGAQIDEAVGDVRSNKTSWSGKQDALLSAGAAVGDQIKVKAVDEDGKPTEWEVAVPGTDYLPGSAIKIVKITTEEQDNGGMSQTVYVADATPAQIYDWVQAGAAVYAIADDSTSVLYSCVASTTSTAVFCQVTKAGNVRTYTITADSISLTTAYMQQALNINLANVGNMIRVDQVSAYVATKFAVAKAGQDYMKTGNIVKQTLVSTPTTPSEEYAINWQYG